MSRVEGPDGRTDRALLSGDVPVTDPSWKERYLTGVHDLSGDCIKVVDHSGRLQSMNLRGQQAMQVEDFRACQGADWLSFWEGEAREAMLDAFALATAGTPAQFSGYCPTMLGEPRWWDVILAPLPDPAAPDHAGPFDLLVVSRDVTDRVQAQQALERMNATLADEVQRQTEALRQEKQLLIQTNEELENITYAMSHDLLTPVRHLLSFARLARQTHEAGKRDRYLGIIETSALNLSGMIDGVMQFSRAGRTSLRLQPVDLNDLHAQVQRDLQPTAPGVHWTAGPLPTVQGDAQALRTVLTILCGNALKYTRDQPSPRVHVSASHDPHARTWRVDVQDNGAGFDPEYGHKLFRLFQRLHHQNEFEGTGTGLALVRRVITRQGGSVQATGRRGEGAVFSFTLPDHAG
ncbi:sensor histidine kinase [Deinococcus depolymerans]